MSAIIWLGKGVFNDETGGHIDNLACFARPGVVCLTWTDRRRDPQYTISLDAWERLREARDARGRRLQVVRLPMPGPLTMSAREAAGVVPYEGSRPRVRGERLAGSYVNFYIANGGIVMPLLDPRTDRQRGESVATPVSPAQARWGAGARDPARRRQHPLHNAADSPVAPQGNENRITVPALTRPATSRGALWSPA